MDRGDKLAVKKKIKDRKVCPTAVPQGLDGHADRQGRKKREEGKSYSFKHVA
jgi:hypothetical protein